MTWQRESTNLYMLVFSAVFCCSSHGNVRVPAWAPLWVFSNALLFMTWQRRGASLKTCWSSQQCSAIHEMATWGYQLEDMLVFTAVPAKLHIKVFGRIGMLLFELVICHFPSSSSPYRSLRVVHHCCVPSVHFRYLKLQFWMVLWWRQFPFASTMALESRALAENKPLCHGRHPSMYSLE